VLLSPLNKAGCGSATKFKAPEILLGAHVALAWGSDGYRTVCAIAWDEMQLVGYVQKIERRELPVVCGRLSRAGVTWACIHDVSAKADNLYVD